MEVIKRKIYLEDSIDRSDNSVNWGTLTATSFYIKVLITQNVDDMGIFSDMDFISKDINSLPPDYSLLIDKLNDSGYDFPFMNGISPNNLGNLKETSKITLRLPEKTESDYYNFGNLSITGMTDSKIEEVRSYNAADSFRVGFDINKNVYTNYKNEIILGVDMVKSIDNPKIYVFSAPNDSTIGTNTQVHGITYLDYIGRDRQVVVDSIRRTIPLTTFRYIGEGWNETNTSLSATIKKEYLFGIISQPEVESDVFIDRGITSVMDMHLRLSEIKDLGQLSRYGNGFYKLNKQ